MNANCSKNLRKYIIEQYDFIRRFHDDKDYLTEEEKINVLFEIILNGEIERPFRKLAATQIDDHIDFRKLQFISKLQRIQMYTDYYRSVKMQDKMCSTHVLKNFPKIKNYGDLVRFSLDENAQYEMFQSTLEYDESSGFDKVLFAKCLDEEDVEHLKTINPFFEYEHEKCNVDVDLEFIVKHIEKWQNQFSYDPELSYDKASRFVFELHELRKEEAEKLLTELFNENLDIISCVDKDDEYIEMGQVKISMDNLAVMLKDYYKYHEKVLKKRR